MNRGIVFNLAEQIPQGKVRFQDKWNIPSNSILPCPDIGMMITCKETEVGVFITSILTYVVLKVFYFTLIGGAALPGDSVFLENIFF